MFFSTHVRTKSLIPVRLVDECSLAAPGKVRRCLKAGISIQELHRAGLSHEAVLGMRSTCSKSFWEVRRLRSVVMKIQRRRGSPYQTHQTESQIDFSVSDCQ